MNVFFRLFWAMMFIISCILSLVSIHGAWLKNQNRPFTIVFDSYYSSSATVPFPAVTVCADSSVIKSRFSMDYTDDNVKNASW